MSKDQFPITPPPELVQQWHNEWRDGTFIGLENYIATQAARWGADQELEACVKWLIMCPVRTEEYLRAARRPKPLSLKEQALEAQQRMWNGTPTHSDWELIRRALEALPND